MSKSWPANEVNAAGARLPEGVYAFTITDASETLTKRAQKYAIRIETRVRGGAFKGKPFSFQFVIGTDSDKGADGAETWKASFAAARYVSLLEATDTPKIGEIEEELASLIGKAFAGEITEREYDGDDGKKHKSSDIASFYAPGAAPQTAPSLNGPAIRQGTPPQAARPVASDLFE